MIYNVSFSVALYCLFIFYEATSEPLKYVQLRFRVDVM